MHLSPSVIAHFINGLFLIIAFILLVVNFAEIKKIASYKLVIIALFFSIAIGVHGLSHLGHGHVQQFKYLN